MANNHAKETGKRVLQNFRDHKGKSDTASYLDLSQSLDNGEGYIESMADGSLLAMAFNESRIHSKQSFESKLSSDTGDNDPLDMIRAALKEVTRIGHDEQGETTHKLQLMLQGVEEYLDANKRSSRKRLNYQLNSSFTNTSSKLLDDDDSGNMPSSPAHDISGFSRHRSVLMENQLDLNESEIDYYEEVVNDLVEKLDKLKEEKDDLQSICNGLGERLHKLGQDHEDEIQRNNAEFSSHMNTLFDKLQTNRAFNFNGNMGESMNSLIELIDTVLQAKSICYENLLQEKLGADATIENNRLAIQELSEKLEQAQELLKSPKEVNVNSQVNQYLGISDDDSEEDRAFPCKACSDDVLSSLKSERDELLLELEKIQSRYHNKSKLYEDLLVETNELRQSVDSSIIEINRLQTIEMKYETACSVQQIESDGEIEVMRSRIIELEHALQQAANESQRYRLELSEEMDRNASIHAMLTKLAEKDDTTEELLDQLRFQNGKLKEEVQELHSKIDSIEAEYQFSLQESSFQLKQMESSVSKGKGKIEELNQEVAKLLDAVESYKLIELNLKKELAHRLEQIDVLSDKYQAVTAESDEYYNSLKSMLSNLTSENKELRNANELLHQKSRSTMEDTQATLVKFHEQVLESFGTVCQMESNLIEGKLESYSKRLDELKFSLQIVASKSSATEDSKQLIQEETLQNILLSTQDALNRALEQRNEDEKRLVSLEIQLFEATNSNNKCIEQNNGFEKENFRLRSEIEKLRDRVLLHPSTDEASELKSKLIEAENRADYLSSEHAKIFAQSARVIAYLESECIRFKTLGDHFRSTNSRVLSDLRYSSDIENKCFALERKLRIANNNEILLINNCKKMEEVIQQKNQELRDLNDQLNSEDRFEVADRIDLTEKLQQENARFRSQIETLLKENELQESELHKINLLKEETKFLLDNKLAHCLQELGLVQNKYEESEFENKRLKEIVDEQNLQLSESELRLSLYTEEMKVATISFQRNENELKLEVIEKARLLSEVEGELNDVKNKLAEFEREIFEKGEELTSNMLKRSQEIDQTRLLRQALAESQGSLTLFSQQAQNLTSENLLLKESIVSLQTKLRDLSLREQELVNQFNNLEINNRSLNATLSGSKSTEDYLRKQIVELELKVERLEDDLNAQNENMHSLNKKNLEFSSIVDNLREDLEFFKHQSGVLSEAIHEADKKYWKLQEDYESKMEALDLQSSSLRVLEEKVSVLECDLLLANQRSTCIDEFLLHFSEMCDDCITQFDEVGVKLEDSSNVLKDLKHSIDDFKNDKSEHIYNFMHSFRKIARKAVIDIQRLQEEVEGGKIVNSGLSIQVAKIAAENADMQELTSTLSEEVKSLTERLYNLQEESQLSRIQKDQLIHSSSDAFSNHIENLQNFVSIINESFGKYVVLISLPHASIANQCLLQRNVDIVNNNLSNTAGMLDGILQYCNEVVLEVLSHLVQTHDDHSQQTRQLQDSLQQISDNLEESESKIMDLQTMIDSRDDLISSLENENRDRVDEISRLELALDEITRNFNDIEIEFKATNDVNSELVKSLEDAEGLYNELKSSTRSLQLELESKDKGLMIANEQMELLRRKVNENELTIEKLSSSNARLKNDRDVLDSLRKSLEAELQRITLELVSFHETEESRMEISKLLFELERVLSAIECMHDSSGNFDGYKSEQTLTNSTLDSKDVHNKCEKAISVLCKFKLRLREDTRAAKALETKVTDLYTDLQQLERIKKDLLEKVKELEAAAALSKREAEDLHVVIERLEKSVDFYDAEKRESESYIMKAKELSEESMRDRAILLQQIQKLEFDLKTAEQNIGLKENKMIQLQEHLDKEKIAVSNFKSELDHRASQVDTIKGNFEKLIASLQHSEVLLEEERLMRQHLEAKLHDVEGSGMSATNLSKLLEDKAREIDRLEALNAELLKEATENRKQVALTNSVVQELKQRLQMCEEQLSKCSERESLAAEGFSQLKLKSADYLSEIDYLKSMNLKLETSVEAMKKKQTEERSKLFSGALISRDELEQKKIQEAEELRKLKSSLQDLRYELSQKEDLLKNSEQQKIKLLRELSATKEELSRTSSDAQNFSSFCNMIRQEVRGTRKVVLDLCLRLKEQLNMVLVDIDTAADSKHSMDLHTLKLDFPATVHDIVANLQDSLCISELSKVVECFKDQILLYRGELKRARSAGAKFNSIAIENTTLKNRIHELENQKIQELGKTKPTSFSAENEQYSKHLQNQLNLLEKALVTEKAENHHLLELLEKMKSMSTTHMQESREMNSTQKHHDYEIQINQKEIESLKVEVKKLSDMLEKERRTSSLVVKTLEDDIQRKFVEHSRIEQERLVHRSNAGDDSGLESNTLKLKVKIRDEILGVYQNALVKLLKDETAEFGIENGFGIKVFCPMVMKETLQITFRAYDQEIQILLDELNNLHSDLRTARLYNAEVRKQFELQMKSIYRVGKDGFPDALVTSLESMRKELSDANDLHTSLQSELNELRSRSFSSLNRLAFDLTDTLQENQKLSTLLSLLERHAKEQHCDLQHYYHVKQQQSTIQTAVPNMSTNQHDQAAIASLVKNLIDADHERLQAERRSKQKSDKLLQSDVATIKHSAKAEMRPSETFLVDKKFVYKNKIATDTTQSNRTFHQTAYDMPILQNSKGTSSLRISKAV